MEDVGGEEEEEVMTMEVEIVRTLVGTVVEAGTLVEEATVETVVGMVETMTEMNRERHENSTRKTLGLGLQNNLSKVLNKTRPNKQCKSLI